MKDEDSVRFAQWWTEVGSTIQGRFAIAVAAWEEAQKSTEGFKRVTGKQHSDEVSGTKEHILTLNDDQYVAQEAEELWSCSGCKFESDPAMCTTALTVSEDFCMQEAIIWIKKED